MADLLRAGAATSLSLSPQPEDFLLLAFLAFVMRASGSVGDEEACWARAFRAEISWRVSFVRDRMSVGWRDGRAPTPVVRCGVFGAGGGRGGRGRGWRQVLGGVGIVKRGGRCFAVYLELSWG